MDSIWNWLMVVSGDGYVIKVDGRWNWLMIVSSDV
jgi:hypothetical protein